MNFANVCLFLFVTFLSNIHVFSNICTESQGGQHRTVGGKSQIDSCAECISIPGCAWCQDPAYANNSNVIISRCNTLEYLKEDGCPKSTIINPKSKSRPTKDADFSEAGATAVGSATQIKPQGMTVKLRPGDPEKIKFSFKLVEDYPVDLYYLLDLSASMKDDLTSLRSLGKELGESMQKITKDLRMGFGSFVDKTLMPYISTSPDKLINPCKTGLCLPAYSFRNDLPLTPDINAFVDSVIKVDISSSIDHPEGGFDAVMQAVVCKEKIKWRSNATHLLVYSSDANVHIAGDGRLGGVVRPNDGQCYLDNRGSYTKGNEMDYPSIGHLVQKINEHKIQPIFAVTSAVNELFGNLQKMIPKSVVGTLSSDSSNIIGLIENAYNDLKGQIVVDVKAPKEITVSETRAECVNSSSEVMKCDGVTLNDIINFEFSLSTETCLTKPAEVVVSVYGYNDVLKLTVLPQCDCNCKAASNPSNCSGHGQYQCGACVCDEGYSGLDCSCDQKDVEGLEAYLKNCTDPTTNAVCNNKGDCQCGKCICRQRPEQKIDGTYCQCDNTTCARAQGKICNNAGRCNCGVCECNSGWSGEACDCTLDETPCFDKSTDALNPTVPCNGNGQCTCGICACGEAEEGGMYRGLFCKTPPIVACEQHKDCVQCLAFGSGRYDEDECQAKCKKYNVTKISDKQRSYKHKCRFVNDADDCQYDVSFEEVGDVIMVDVDTAKICTTYASPIIIIIAIVAAIVGIGLAILLIWKLLTSIKDAREFKNFQKESANAKWQADTNPIYKQATSTFRNPMYTGARPTSGI